MNNSNNKQQPRTFISTHYGCYSGERLPIDKKTFDQLTKIISKFTAQNRFLKISYTVYEGDIIIKELK